MRLFLCTVSPGIVYVHNGGRFDFFYLLDWLDKELQIINTRIVKALAINGHELRDSYALMPFPLAAYKKTEIDYNRLKKEVRLKHKKEIVSYLKDDCVDLWTLCSAFVDEFGIKLTIGGTSMGELKKIHEFESLNQMEDAYMRNFYFGGRVQCFEKGIIKGEFKVYDVNSMYPYAMKNFRHPIGRPSFGKEITDDTCFIVCTGINKGAFPYRDRNTLTFKDGENIYHVSIHEWRAAIDCGMFEPRDVLQTINFERQATFANFVDTFFDKRKAASDAGDEIHKLFYKYVLNSCYGKFAQNPDSFRDYTLTNSREENLSEYGWELQYVFEENYFIWSRPVKFSNYYNVATGASITGAARSVLLRALANSTHPIYCDTDSIICKDLLGVEKGSIELGAWKLEATGNKVAIAGKKMYAFYSDRCLKCTGTKNKPLEIDNKKCKSNFHATGCIKLASKGMKLTAQNIVDVCKGKSVVWRNEAPSFKLSGAHQFIERNARMT